MKTKPFEEVQVGDMAYSCDIKEEPEGKVLAMGTYEELSHNYHSTTDIIELKKDGVSSDTNAVAIEQNPADSMEMFPNLIFLYDFDPCSVHCKKG